MDRMAGSLKQTHLGVDELLDFVTLSELNDDAARLCASVNCHIRGCAMCRRRVRAFQEVHEAFLALHTQADFRDYAVDACEEIWEHE